MEGTRYQRFCPAPTRSRRSCRGFRVTNLTGLVVNVGQELTVNLTLQVAGVQETITVTGQSPLVEATSSRIGTNVTSTEIDGLPSANRSQFSLMQTIPGLVPVLQVGIVRGRPVQRQRAGDDEQPVPRRRAERQRLPPRRIAGHAGARVARLDGGVSGADAQYAAEYGGSTGVVVNSVTKSGTNKLSGRMFEYYQSNKLQATNYFLKQAGEENPGIGQQRLRRQHRRSDRQEQGVLLRELRGHALQRRGESQLPGRGRAARRVVLDDDGVSRAEYVRAVRLPRECQQPDQLPLDARGRDHRARFDRGRPGRCSSAARHENDSGDQVFSGRGRPSSTIA